MYTYMSTIFLYKSTACMYRVYVQLLKGFDQTRKIVDKSWNIEKSLYIGIVYKLSLLPVKRE